MESHCYGDIGTSVPNDRPSCILCLPQGGGGGGSNPLKVVLSVAVMVAAYYTGGIAAGTYGTLAGAAAATAVSVGGSMLVNAVIPSPSSSLSSSYASSSMETSPTYSLNARGNQAKLGGVISVLYGRHIIYPDFAAKPYTEYKITSSICTSSMS